LLLVEPDEVDYLNQKFKQSKLTDIPFISKEGDRNDLLR